MEQIKEIERKAENQRVDFEARAQEQRINLERQVEALRLEFQRQLEEQRKSMEEQQNRLRQQEIEAHFQAQINQSIQAYLPASPTIPTPPLPTTDEVARRMESQDARIQHLTDLIQQLVAKSPLEASTQPARLSTGKRHAPPHSVVDLVMDHGDLENASQQSRNDHSAKKRDTKDTPRQDLVGNISIQLERTASPAASDLSMSMMEPSVSQTEESLLWNGIHPPSEVYSPPAQPRAYRTGIETSPMSNLALQRRVSGLLFWDQVFLSVSLLRFLASLAGELCLDP